MLPTPGTTYTSPELPGALIRVTRVITDNYQTPYAVLTFDGSPDTDPIEVTSDLWPGLIERFSLSPLEV